MKRVGLLVLIVFFIGFAVHAQSGQQNAPIDLVLLLDTGVRMSSSYDNVNNYITGGFLKEFLRIGDTFHLIAFSETQRLDVARSISGAGDVEVIIGRMMLQYPLERGSNVSSVLAYAEQYVANLPTRPKKIVLVTIGDDNTSDLVSRANQRLSQRNTTIDFVKVTPGQPITNAPVSGRPQQQGTGVREQGTGVRDQVAGTATTQDRTTTGTTGGTTAATGDRTTAGTADGRTATTQDRTTTGTTGGTTAATGDRTTAGTADGGTATTQDRTTTDSTGATTGDRTAADTAGGTAAASEGGDRTTTSDSTTSDGTGRTTADGADRTTDTGTDRATDTTALGTQTGTQTGQRSSSRSFASLPWIIGIILLLLLIIGLIMLIASRRLGSSPNRVMAGVASGSSSSSGERVDHSGDLARYAQGQSGKRYTPYHDRPSKPGTATQIINPNGPLSLNLYVEDQSTLIGKRNIHSLKSGYSLSVGGSKGDGFLIFLVPLPGNLGELRRNGSQLTFVPKKAKYFPDIGSNEVRDCLDKTIRVISDKNYELQFRFEMYEDPLVALNRMLNSIKVPG